MGKTYKIIVCGKRAIGKTTILEHLIYNNSNISTSSSSGTIHRPSTTSISSDTTVTTSNSKYIPTIEDIYVACWEKDKGVKEKLRFYDTRGLENAKDGDSINLVRHLFSQCDGAVLVFTSSDPDSITCIEKLKLEIERSKDSKRDLTHFICIDNVNVNGTSLTSGELARQELATRLRVPVYEMATLDRREVLCKPFVDLAMSMTQVSAKGSMNLVQSIKKPKVFSSNK